MLAMIDTKANSHHMLSLDLLLQCATSRWHIEGKITHDWKKLAERKAKQLRKLSDTYKGQLDKVLPPPAFFRCYIVVFILLYPVALVQR